MTPSRTTLALACLLAASLAGCSDGGERRPYRLEVSPDDFGDGVVHPYLPLQPGSIWVYEAETEDGTETITVQVLDRTRVVNGVNATVVRDTVTLDGEVVEDTYDWFAQDRDGTVWYLGEDTTEYEDGEASKEGSWEWGVDGALPGIVMPAAPQPGTDAYYMEYYPGEAEDQAQVIDLGRRIQVPFGTFEDTVTTREWTELEAGSEELAHYARGVGVVRKGPEDGGPAETLVAYTPG